MNGRVDLLSARLSLSVRAQIILDKASCFHCQGPVACLGEWSDPPRPPILRLACHTCCGHGDDDCCSLPAVKAYLQQKPPTLPELVSWMTSYADRQGFYPEGWSIAKKLDAISNEAIEAETAFVHHPEQPFFLQEGKPEGYAVELIDTFSRICSLLGHLPVEVLTLLYQKILYNEGRPYRHNKEAGE